MGFYWEKHQKKFENGRLSWYGDDSDASFWSDFWQKGISDSYFDHYRIADRKLSSFQRLLIQELDPTDRIIEAGCGAGDWVAFLKYQGYSDVTGIEISADLVDRLAKIDPTLNIRQGDALHIASESNYYNACLSFGVVEHRFEGPEPFLAEALRVLKPGGKLLVTVPYVGSLRHLKALMGLYNDPIAGLPFFQYGFGRAEFLSLIRSAGYQIRGVKLLNLDRLLLEECLLYRKLAGFKKLRQAQKMLTNWFHCLDGHMLLVVAIKPGSSPCAA